MCTGIYVGQARWSLGGTGRYERGSAIAANRPHSFVPPLSPFTSLTSFACFSLHIIHPLSLFLSLCQYRYRCHHSPIYSRIWSRMSGLFSFVFSFKIYVYDIAWVKAGRLVTVGEPRKKHNAANCDRTESTKVASTAR